MMAGYDTMVDRAYRRRSFKPDEQEECSPGAVAKQEWRLPKTALQAMWRGARNRCPSCERTKFFPKFLKPIDRCEICDQDWTPQQADDFPAYVAIILTGHLMAPLIIALIGHTDLPMWMNTTIILSLTIFLTLSLLQPAKGAIIALQWRMGMHGFKRPTQTSLEHVAEDEG
jgi:uncharacterized protein (DUF983 family)